MSTGPMAAAMAAQRMICWRCASSISMNLSMRSFVPDMSLAIMGCTSSPNC